MQNHPLSTKFQQLFGPKTEEEQLELGAKLLHAHFIKQLENLLEMRGMSRKELAAKMGTSPGYITQLFQGDRLVNMKVLAKFQKALDFEYRVVMVQEDLVADLLEKKNVMVTKQLPK